MYLFLSLVDLITYFQNQCIYSLVLAVSVLHKSTCCSVPWQRPDNQNRTHAEHLRCASCLFHRRTSGAASLEAFCLRNGFNHAWSDSISVQKSMRTGFTSDQSVDELCTRMVPTKRLLSCFKKLLSESEGSSAAVLVWIRGNEQLRRSRPRVQDCVWSQTGERKFIWSVCTGTIGGHALWMGFCRASKRKTQNRSSLRPLAPTHLKRAISFFHFASSSSCLRKSTFKSL